MELSKKNCYIYLGVPFLNNLELKTIIQRINNKVRIVLYSIKEFLKNPHIPIPYKRMLFSTIVIGQVSYYIMHFYLDQTNKQKKKKKKKKKKKRM